MPLSPTILCNNILMRAFQDRISVTPMKLQKLMYFVACEYAKATDRDLFSENFSVWQYGPVLPTVYSEFRSFRDQPISDYAKDATGTAYAVDETTAPELKAILDRVWDRLKNQNGIYLSKITHLDGSGWSRAYCEDRTEITKEDMKADTTYDAYLC